MFAALTSVFALGSVVSTLILKGGVLAILGAGLYRTVASEAYNEISKNTGVTDYLALL